MKNMKNSTKIWLLLCICKGLIASQDENNSGYDRYTQFNQNLQDQASQAELRLAKLNKLKSIDKQYPNAARLAAESHSPEIDDLTTRSNAWFPSVNSKRFVTDRKYANDPRIITTKSYPFSSKNTIYKKGSTFDRIPNAMMMEKAIQDNSLQHLAIAKKSIVQDKNNDWIVATKGVEEINNADTSSLNYSVSLANSLSLEEIQDLIKFTQETGFVDWTYRNMNMIRDRKNKNKLTVIDTESGSLLNNNPDENSTDDRLSIRRIIPHGNPIDKLAILEIVKEKIGLNAIEKRERTGKGRFEDNDLHLKPEVRDYINGQIAILSQEPSQPINSLVDPKNKYNNPNFNSQVALDEFNKMNKASKETSNNAFTSLIDYLTE